MAPRPVVIDAPAALEPWVERWDALAVAAGRPLCAPGWMLAWWEHLRPARTELRVVLVADGERLLGVAPFFLHHGRAGRRDARILCAGHSHRLDVLAAPQARAATAAALAQALAPAKPSLVGFEGFDAASSWPSAVAAAWPGGRRPARVPLATLPTPIVELGGGGHAAWLGSQSKNFRKKTGQARRRLTAAGGRVELASGAAAHAAAIAAFERLHEARWAGRGGTSLPAAPTGAMLKAAFERLAEGRLRLWTVVIEDRIAAVQVFVAAGGEVANWNGGWDERYARLQPALLALLGAIEDAATRGERRIDMGGGDDDYKLRFADPELRSAITTTALLPPGARVPLTRLELLPERARRALRGALRGHARA